MATKIFHRNVYIHPDNAKAIAFFKAQGVGLTEGELCIVDYDYTTDEPIRTYRKVLFVDLDMGGRKFHKLLVDNDLLCGKSTLDYVDYSSVENFRRLLKDD